jgi:hypothetical protein
MQASNCLQELCLSENEREAFELYVKVQNLNAIGGANYTGAQGFASLMSDSKQWQPLFCDQRKAIEAWIDMDNALDNGASFNTNINAIKADPVFMLALAMGREFRKNTTSYLKCAINSAGKAD